MGAGSTVRELLLLVGMGQGARGLSGSGVGPQFRVCQLGEGGPGCPVSEVEENPAAGAGQRGGDGEEPQPEPFRFPPAGLMRGQRQELHPRGDLGGESDDGEPDLVLGKALEREGPQSCVLRGPDPVLGPGPPAVT